MKNSHLCVLLNPIFNVVYYNWQNVRYHYDIWTKPDKDGISLIDRILQKLVEME